jgi:hypothetical protein
MGDESIKNYIISNDLGGLEYYLNFKKETGEALMLNFADNNKILPLNWAILFNRYEITELLLKMGADPNGKCNIGVSKTTPICECLYTRIGEKNYIMKGFDDVKRFVKLLQKYGADINGYGLDLKPIIIWFFLSFNSKINAEELYEEQIDKLEFLLKRGADPNFFINPAINKLSVVCSEKADIIKDNKNLQNIILSMFKILLYFNGQSNKVNINGFSAKDDLAIIRTKDPEFVYKIDSLLFSPLEQFLNDCNEPKMVQKLANIFKIPYDEDNLDEDKMKEICDCIKNIKKHKKHIDFDQIKEQRKEKDNVTCNNEYTISGSEISEFNKKLLYILKGENDIPYCFHINELVQLLQGRKNPWTNQPLNEDNIIEITNTINFVPNSDNDFEYFEDEFEIKNLQHFTLNDLLSVLDKFIKTFNPYVQVEGFIKMNGYLLNWFKNEIAKITNQYLNITILSNISAEYLQLKLYNLISIILNGLEQKFDLTTLNSLFIEPVLLLQDMRETISKYFLENDIDLSLPENNDLIKKIDIKNLSSKKLINLDGKMVNFKQDWVDEILKIIKEKAKQSLFDDNLPGWENKLWNKTLGYAFDKY